MANTVTNTVLIKGQRKYIQYITVVSDGTEESDLVVFDSSAAYAAVGLTDLKDAAIEKVTFSGAKAANTGTITLEWDATTDVVAFPITFSSAGNSTSKFCFEKFGGLPNYAGTGKTGDLLMTTTGLDAGDSFVIILEMRMT